MKQKQIIYDCKTGQTRIEEVEIDDIIEELPIQQEPTLEERVTELENIVQEQNKFIQELRLLKN